MAPAKMFPRGGQLVSTGQKTKRVMSKVKKQQGKKNDLFAEKRVFKEQITPALREKFKGRTQKQKEREEMPQMVKENLGQVDIDATDDTDDLPKFPINVTPKMIKPGTVAMVAIRTVDQFGLACAFPGGHTAYIRAQNISPQVEATCSAASNNRFVCETDLSQMYKPGEVITAQVVYVNKRHKIDLTLRPEVLNAHLGKFQTGNRVQGIISSIEDEGIIVDLGRGETSKGFIAKGNLATPTIGKAMSFTVSDVLLDGRQITLDVADGDSEPLEQADHITNLAPGQFVTFASARQHRNGLVGRCFAFGATLHSLQADEDLLDASDPTRIIKTRIVLMHYDDKRILLGNNDSIMSTAPLKEVKCRNGEVLEAQIEVSEGYGLILFDSSTQSRLYCPYHNITDETSDKDTMSKYPVGRMVKARIIANCYLEGVRLVTMRESTVEAEFFRYDDFVAGQKVTGKIQQIDAAGWIHVSLAPNLFGVINSFHQGATMLSDEGQKSRFKVGGSCQCMVLDTSKNKLFLTAKPALMKSKLKKIVSHDETEIGDVTLGTIVSRSERGVQVQLFNSIIVQVPVRHLSLEYIETAKITSLFEQGQTIRLRLMEKPNSASSKKRWIGSFVLDAKLRQERLRAEMNKVELGAKFDLRVDEVRDNATILGTLMSGDQTKGRALLEHVALGYSSTVRAAMLAHVKEGTLLNSVTVVNSSVKGTRVTANPVVAAALGFDQFAVYEGDDIKPDEQYLAVVRKETDFGFMIAFTNGQRGLLPRAALVDAYIKNHSGCLSIGDVILVKVTQADQAKKRFVVTSKESEVAQPEWLGVKSIVEMLKCEIESALKLANINLEFGSAVQVKFGNKAACEREQVEPIELVDCQLPEGIRAVCCGPEIQSTPSIEAEAVFVGFHEANQLLFCLKPLTKAEEEKVFYSNGDFALTQKNDQIGFILARTSRGIRHHLKTNRAATTDSLGPIGQSGLILARLSDSAEQIERKKWGIMDLATIKPGLCVEGTVVGVKHFGIQIAIGYKLVGRCMFRNVTQAFLPKEKSLTVCEKYLKKGMSVVVEILECQSRNKLEFKMTKEYIDIDAEGLFCNKKRKTEIKLAEQVKAPKKPKVEEEVDVKEEVKEAAEEEMDMDDDLEAELERRKKAKNVVKETKQAATSQMTTDEMEDASRQAERDAEQAKLPDNVDGWERAIIASPNNSELWLRYAAHHITLGEIERARVVFDRALKTINFREGEEKMNVWKARLNLEAMYGDEEGLIERFNEAKRCNDEYQMYVALIEQQMGTEKYSIALRLLKEAVKKFPSDHKLWAQMGRCQMSQSEPEKARVTMERALQANKSKDHVSIVQKFARLEFELGDVEKGKTIFEQTIALYPKRGDVWSVYADLLMKFESIDQAVSVLERGLEEIEKRQPRNHLIKRLVYMEQRRGDEESAQEWRNRLV